MPAKNIVKVYNENGYYHIYNRGVEKRSIFLDEQDYLVFLGYLQSYLTTPKRVLDTSPSKALKNYATDIDLLCYCLMPNHFHLLIHQHSPRAITDFTRSLSTRYSMYFNRKYDRIGSLFQGTFKAVLINSERQLVYLTHYIHHNPSPTGFHPAAITKYRFSSIADYLGKGKQLFLKPGFILDLFSSTNPNLSYRSFVLDSKIESPAGFHPAG